MGLLLSGRQIHAFFQDPRYWGRGQSFKNLSLRVNGQVIDASDFANGWDVADLNDADIVEVMGGAWLSRGCLLTSHEMPEVVQCWISGVNPVQPQPRKDASKPVEAQVAAVKSAPATVEVAVPAVKRPSFSLR